MEWVAFPFSRGSSQPRDSIQVSRTVGGFFTSWARREAQAYWSGQPVLSTVDFPDPGIKPGSPALQADSLPAELQGKPKNTEMGSLSFLQRIFLTQESNQGLLHCRRILYQLSYQGSPITLYTWHQKDIHYTALSHFIHSLNNKPCHFIATLYWFNFYY